MSDEKVKETPEQESPETTGSEPTGSEDIPLATSETTGADTESEGVV